MSIYVNAPTTPSVSPPITTDASFTREHTLSLEMKRNERTKEKLIERIIFYHYHLCMPRDIDCCWDGIKYSPNTDELLNMSYDSLLRQLKEYKKLDKTIRDTPRGTPLQNKRRRDATKKMIRNLSQDQPHLDPMLFGS
jgi:hypothetical protein